MTRGGTLFAYATSAPACSPSSWPRFHHDNANSGDMRRDAVAPGKPFGVAASTGEISFKAPGNDLLCGTAPKYEVVQSDSPIDAANFEHAEPVTLDKPIAPVAAGAPARFTVPAGTKRYVAFRALDEAKNAGRPAVVDRSAGASGGGGGVSGGPGNTTGGGGAGGGGGGSGGGGGTQGGGCEDRVAPRSAIVRTASHVSRRSLFARGSATDGGCPRSRVKREYVSVALVQGTTCRFVTKRGFLTHVRRCGNPVLIRARGTRRWSLSLGVNLPPGRYRLVARGVDAVGNLERPRRSNAMHLRVR
jgi:hypothetical protein